MSVPARIKNLLASAWATDSPYVAVFTGAAGENGANEAAGGGYTRQRTTFGSANSGQIVGAEVEVPVAAGNYAEGGLMSTSSGGNFGGSKPFTGGTVTVTGTGASIKITPKITVS